MKIKNMLKLICIVLVISFVFVIPTAYAQDRSDIPQGYVITDGATYYWISYNDLLTSYVSYSINPNSDDGKLAKFYFDTLGSDITSSMAAYVSDVTTKFVSYNAILVKYVATGNVDSTYIWFNSTAVTDATPAFDVITEVKIMGFNATVTGTVYVGVDGYIIILPTYSITIPGSKSVTIPANQTNVYLNLGNPEGNPCYFVISLRLEDGTELYKSGQLLPGEVIGNVVLNQPLVLGEYNASILYEAFDLVDLSPLNNAVVNVKLIAE